MARKKDIKKEIKETKKKSETPIEKENIEVMSLDNKPINNEVVKEPTNIPNKFINIPSQKPTTNENKIKIHNGRVYKDVGNGYGMYADNGETFRIK